MSYSFQLYVSMGAPGSMHAIKNLEAICLRLGQASCQIEIVDVREAPGRAEQARILAIPTLIKSAPLPALRVIGDLGDHQRILEALGWTGAVAQMPPL